MTLEQQFNPIISVCVAKPTLASRSSVLLVRVSACWSLSWNSLGVRIAGAKKRRKKKPLMARYLTSCERDASQKGKGQPTWGFPRAQTDTANITQESDDSIQQKRRTIAARLLDSLSPLRPRLTSFSGSVNCSSTLLCSCLKATLMTGGHWSTEPTMDSMMPVR